MPLWKDIIVATHMNACWFIALARFKRRWKSRNTIKSTTIGNVLTRAGPARTCPPGLAFPELPRLPELPREVDPDRWLEHLHGQAYVRHVGSDGCVTVDERS